MLLAAIAAADPETQTPQLQAPELLTIAQPGVTQAPPAAEGQPSVLPAANDDDADITIETAVGSKTNTVQDPSLDADAVTAPKSVTKPDKKANTDKTGADITAASPLAQPQIPVLPQPPIAPMVQAAVQTQAVASNDDDSDSALGTPASSAVGAALPASSTANTAQPVVPQPPQAGIKQTAALSRPLAAANDDNADNSDVLNNFAPTDQAKPATHLAEAKFTQVRNPDSKSVIQTAPQPQTSATMDEDADMAPEPAGLPIANTLTQTAPTPAQASPADTAPVSPVPPAPQKPDSRAAAIPAPDKIADLLPPGANNVAADAKDLAQNPTSAPPMTADKDSDSKPAHAAVSAAPQAQPDAPPPPSQMNAAAMPQVTPAINPAGTNAAGGLTLAVHVASHDAGSQSSTPFSVVPDIDALAISVAARSIGGSKQFDIRLDPPELGRVEVRLSIDASGKTQAHMTADQPQTLELLQKDATNLTRALRDAGLDVSQNGLNFSLKGQSQNGGGQSGNFGTPSRSLSLPAIAQNIEAAQPANIPYSLLGNARLDIHV